MHHKLGRLNLTITQPKRDSHQAPLPAIIVEQSSGPGGMPLHQPKQRKPFQAWKKVQICRFFSLINGSLAHGTPKKERFKFLVTMSRWRMRLAPPVWLMISREIERLSFLLQLELCLFSGLLFWPLIISTWNPGSSNRRFTLSMSS